MYLVITQGHRSPADFIDGLHRVCGTLSDLQFKKQYMQVYDLFWRVSLQLLNDTQWSQNTESLSTAGYKMKYLKHMRGHSLKQIDKNSAFKFK